MWSIILVYAKGPLVFLEKEWCTNVKPTVDSEMYIRHILPLVSTFQEDYWRRKIGRDGIYQNFISMEDNATVHTSNVTTAAFEALGINRWWWPANSTDLNLIKNVWQLLKCRLTKRFLKTDAEVKQYLKEEWEKIEVDDYKKYITSMRDRCWTVIKAGGGSTKW